MIYRRWLLKSRALKDLLNSKNLANLFFTILHYFFILNFAVLHFTLKNHSADRPPSKKTNPYTGFRITKSSGNDLVWSGAVVFDRKQKRFTRFDLLAVGERWGGSLYNFRDTDLNRAPIGFAFQIIPNVDDNPTPPSYLAYYNF